MSESREDIIDQAIKYSDVQFKKVVKVVNETSEQLAVHYPKGITKIGIISFLASIEGMIQSYKSHAFSRIESSVYNEVLNMSYELAEQACETKTVNVEEGIKA